MIRKLHSRFFAILAVALLVFSLGVSITAFAKTEPAGFGSVNSSPTVVKGKVVEINAPATFAPGKECAVTVGSEDAKASYNVSAATLVKGKVTEVKKKKLKAGQVWTIYAPAGAGLLAFFLDGDKPTGTVISQPADNSAYDFPRCPANVVSGGIADLTGTGFSPILGENQVGMGGRNAEVLASSPTSLKVRVPNLPPGHPVVVKVSSGGREQKLGTTTPISLEASVGQETMLKDQSTKLTATIKGSTDVYAIQCQNLSPEIVEIDGRQDETVVYTKGGEDNSASLTLNGKEDGDYQMIMTAVIRVSDPVSVEAAGECTECWKAYEACCNTVAADEKQCYKDCDKAGGETSCYLACSAAARLQEAECMAAYVGCMRKKILGL